MLQQYFLDVAGVLASLKHNLGELAAARQADPPDPAAIHERNLEAGYGAYLLVEMLRSWRLFFNFADIARLPRDSIPGIVDAATWVEENVTLVAMVKEGHEVWKAREPAAVQELLAGVFAAAGHPGM